MVFAVWAAPEPPHPGLLELEDALVASIRAARADPAALAHQASKRYGYPPGFLARYFEKLRYRFGTRERGSPAALRARARGRRARRGARLALRHCGGDGLMATTAAVLTTSAILEKALEGERINDAEALALLESRDLVAVGRAANELRGRRTDPGRVTFIVDRNIDSRTSASPTATSAPSIETRATSARGTSSPSR